MRPWSYHVRVSLVNTDHVYRLSVASGDYHHALSKKKESMFVDGDEKLLAIDALGIVMIQHGEEFGDDSAFGASHARCSRIDADA